MPCAPGPAARELSPRALDRDRTDGGRAVAKRILSRGKDPIVAGLCLGVFAVPLTVNAFGAPFHAGFRVLALVLGIALLARGRKRAASPPAPLLWPWLALWALGLVLAPITLDPPAALAQALDRTAIGVFFLCLIAAAPTPEARRPIVWAGVAGLAAVAAWGLLQRFGIHPFMDPRVWEPSRPTRPLGTHNLMGGFLAAWMPAAVALALGARGGGRWFAAAAALIGFACFLQTESRGAWLAFFLAAAGVGGAWLARGGLRLLGSGSVPAGQARTRWAIGLGAAALVIAAISAGTLLSRLGTRERSGVLQGEARPTAVEPSAATPASPEVEPPSGVPPASALTSFERRRLVAETAVRLLGERPAFGWGPGSFRLAFYTKRPPAMQRLEAETGETAVHAHSDPLELGVELGLAGLLCVAFGLAMALPGIARRLDPRAKRAPGAPPAGPATDPLLELALAIGGAAILLHSTIDFDLHEAPTALTAAVLFGLMWPPARAGGGVRPPGTAGRIVSGVATLALLVAIGLTLLAARSDWAYRRAYRVLARGDVAGSEAWLRVALSGVPDEARIWIARGEVERHRARQGAASDPKVLEEAVASFRRAAEIEPQIAARWQRLAIVMQEALGAGLPLGAPASQAAHAFADRLGAAVNQAHATNPLDPLNSVLLGELATQARFAPESARAGMAVSILTRIAAGEGGAAGSAARYLGDLALARGAAGEAHSWYDRALTAGENPELDLALGHLARFEGQLAVADGHYRRALAARPGAPAAYEGLRDLAVARGDSGEARRWDREAQRHVREGR